MIISNNNLSKRCIGTWKNKDINLYYTLYEGGIGYAYSNKEEFITTGYAPQPLSWEVKEDVVCITYKLTNSSDGYKYDAKKKSLISVDKRNIYIKEE